LRVPVYVPWSLLAGMVMWSLVGVWLTKHRMRGCKSG
jgi:hypothetical protein